MYNHNSPTRFLVAVIVFAWSLFILSCPYVNSVQVVFETIILFVTVHISYSIAKIKKEEEEEEEEDEYCPVDATIVLLFNPTTHILEGVKVEADMEEYAREFDYDILDFVQKGATEVRLVIPAAQ